MKKEAVEWILDRMAKVHDFLEMWQGSQNLRATQKESRTQNKQMTAVGYILHMEQIVKASWSLFVLDGLAAFRLSKRSPLPPPLSAKDLQGRRTQSLTVRRIRRINHHPVGTDEDSALEIISVTEDWLNSNRNLLSPNDSNYESAVDFESHIEEDNSIEHPEGTRAAGYECRAKCRRIALANTEIEGTGWKDVGDSQCNRNEEESGSEEQVGQNASMFHQLLYVSWPRAVVSDISWANGEQ